MATTTSLSGLHQLNQRLPEDSDLAAFHLTLTRRRLEMQTVTANVMIPLLNNGQLRPELDLGRVYSVSPNTSLSDQMFAALEL